MLDIEQFTKIRTKYILEEKEGTFFNSLEKARQEIERGERIPSFDPNERLWRVEGSPKGKKRVVHKVWKEVNGIIRWHCTCHDYHGVRRPVTCVHIQKVLLVDI